MYSSENVHVKFRIVKPMITDVIDMFGKDVIFSDENETHVTVTAKTNERANAAVCKEFCSGCGSVETGTIAGGIAGGIRESAGSVRIKGEVL